ncbi:zinc finger protein 76-like [Oppia nitens]|uniref:zinc finger protein 76-like n=1 Tax=Oppia nitens TaxID=1686743 RepID=UPI0023DAD0D8|nr:zinc finger protein 76-like [Oppia nitens]
MADSLVVSRDMFEDVREENRRLRHQLSVERQLNEVLDQIRRFSMDLKSRCQCRQVQDIGAQLNQLDLKYKTLKDGYEQSLRQNNYHTDSGNDRHRVRPEDCLQMTLHEDTSAETSPQMASHETQTHQMIADAVHRSQTSHAGNTVAVSGSGGGQSSTSSGGNGVLVKCLVNGCPFSSDISTTCVKHMQTAHSLTPYECRYPSCGQLVLSKQELDGHMNAAHFKKQFICNSIGCGKEFKSLWNLNMHLMTHSGEKRFKCSVDGCGYQAIQKRHLVAHMYKHYGLKPFQCKYDACGKCFSTLGSLRTHESELHPSNETRFVCDICNKVLKTQRYLLQHKKQHFTPEKPGGGHHRQHRVLNYTSR